LELTVNPPLEITPNFKFPIFVASVKAMSITTTELLVPAVIRPKLRVDKFPNKEPLSELYCRTVIAGIFISLFFI
jgi:hypothetical protein